MARTKPLLCDYLDSRVEKAPSIVDRVKINCRGRLVLHVGADSANDLLQFSVAFACMERSAR